MTDLDTIWRELEAETPPASEGHFARLLPSSLPGIIRLRWSVPSAIRGIEFELLSSEIPPNLRLPKGEGFSSNVSSNRAFGSLRTTILLEASAPKYNEIFSVMTADLLALPNNDSDTPHLIRISDRLADWAEFFRRQAESSLSEELQLGIIGELLMMRDFLIPFWGAELTILSWAGPFRRPQDFQGPVAVEVKSTLGSAGRPILVSNLRQLDPSLVGKPLYLAVLRAEVVAAGGATLLEVVREIKGVLPKNLHQDFESRLLRSGVSAVSLESNRLPLFRALNWRLYRVADDFPRIVEGDVRHGVLDARYSISLTACDSFAVDMSELDCKEKIADE
ncbi:MAG: PD-(D/E)XK motif protein [Gemmatimonadaceae bacterium]|nr:PD-(D/E)XK motif protein [Gemmatimonadaceae bacterium]